MFGCRGSTRVGLCGSELQVCYCLGTAPVTVYIRGPIKGYIYIYIYIIVIIQLLKRGGQYPSYCSVRLYDLGQSYSPPLVDRIWLWEL